MEGLCRNTMCRQRWFLQLVFALALVISLPAPCKAWLRYSAPPIRGTITDATTGNPIKDVILEVRWHKTIYAIVDTQTEVMKRMYVATDDKGQFRIPGHSSIHLFSKFADVSWIARHPLHSTVELGMGRDTIDAISRSGMKRDKTGPGGSVHAARGTSGEIVYDFSLLSLKEKFRESPSLHEFRGELYREFLSEGPRYFRASTQLGLTVHSSAILAEWDELAGRFPSDENLQTSLELGKRKIAAGSDDGD